MIGVTQGRKMKYITVKSHRYSSDIDLKLVSFSAQCKIFFLKQRHEANELKICRTAFNFVSWDSHQTISNFQIGSTEIRCKLSLLSIIIEPNSIVDILTEKISLKRKKEGTPKQKQLHVPRLHLISPKIKVEQYIQFCPSNLLRR